MTDENYFVIKNFCDLTSPVRFRVGSPNKFHSHYDSEPEAMLEILLRVFKKSSKRNLKGFGIRDAVGVWLSSPRGAVDPKARIHWGGDGMGLMIPPQEKFPLGVIQEAAALRTSISFAYMKAGELPVIVSGIPRAVDSARRLVVLDSPSPTHPRNFLVDEIVGFYEKPVNGLVSWCFELEPLSRGRLKVTLSLEDGFPRKTQRRIARRSEAGKLLATQPEVQGTLAVEEAIVRGDLIELATADGRVFGLRVEYEREVSHD